MEGPYKLYFSPNLIGTKKSRSMRWAVPCITNGEKMNASKFSAGKLVGKRLLGTRK
jgi:hypothetical protein